MNSSLLNSRRIVGGIALSFLAAAIFVLVRWMISDHEDASLNSDRLIREQSADTGHRRVSSMILERNGNLERAVLKIDGVQNDPKTKEENKPLPISELNLVATLDDYKQALPRAGLAPANMQQSAPKKMATADKRDSMRDRQIANSAKLPGYHLEQRNRMIVPQAPDSSVLDTPERSVPKAQGNRLPTASYTPPQS